ncbi:universal stress protein [Natrarchaeobius halalkaliphilus]|uniref:Universal stress protein n=1 Tax=Natrarchaeobius halalkaliphilus TaxID=1679091 RepID=A0A3N6LLE3_9EURY|nr:universal stress protein [Natrarchaeobius halalkaliphilus]RQG87920.1 universal stress protein [Natrarchaeobius halalkaliphilus]
MAIVAAVDREERSRHVIREAERLADSFGDSIHVVHVLTRSEFVEMGVDSAESGTDGVSMDDIRDAATRIAAEAGDDIESEWEAVGLIGDPATRVIEYADEQDARYVVVAPRKRSPTGKVLFGSVAQTVLLNADRPVVTVLEGDSS